MSSQESSTLTVQQIADVLRAANEKGGPALVDALARFAADQVTIRHHPPRQHVDGVFSGSEWIKFERSVVEKVGARATGMKSEDKKVRVADDTIVIEEVIAGEAPDGTPFRIPSRMVLPVHDGRILGYDAYYDASATPSFMEDAEIEARKADSAGWQKMTIDEMAQAIHEAHTKGMPHLLDVLRALAAEQVTITYHPPRPFVEGTMSGEEWIAFERGMVAKAEDRELGVHTSDHKIAVKDDDIILEEVEEGTGPDGNPFRIPFKAVFHVSDRKITGYDAYFDPSTTPDFLEQDEKSVRESLENEIQQ